MTPLVLVSQLATPVFSAAVVYAETTLWEICTIVLVQWYKSTKICKNVSAYKKSVKKAGLTRPARLGVKVLSLLFNFIMNLSYFRTLFLIIFTFV